MWYADVLAVLVAASVSPMDAWLGRGEFPPVGSERVYSTSLALSDSLFLDHGETRCVSNGSHTVYMHDNLRADKNVPSVLVVKDVDSACQKGGLAGLGFVSGVARSLDVLESDSEIDKGIEGLNQDFMSGRGFEIDRCVSEWREFAHGFATRYRGYHACLLKGRNGC